MSINNGAPTRQGRRKGKLVAVWGMGRSKVGRSSRVEQIEAVKFRKPPSAHLPSLRPGEKVVEFGASSQAAVDL